MSIRERDNNDTSRTIAPLKPAKNSIIYDSTNRKFDEVVTYFLELIRGYFEFDI